jgi:hypothetical protein
MPDAGNPYQSPSHSGEVPIGASLSFGQVIRRGFAAAHGVPAGAFWCFLLMVPLQVTGAVMNQVMFGSDLFEQLQTGEFEDTGKMPAGLITIIGAGCSMCIFLPIMFFALPLVWGGTVGQLRDRIVGREMGAFGHYGKKFYVPMLLVVMMLCGAVFVVSFANGIVGQIIASTEIQPGQPMTTEQLQALSRHPLNLISSAVTWLVMGAIGILVNLVGSAMAARGRGIGDALSQGFSFCGNHFGSVFKLYLVGVALFIPLAVLQSLPMFVKPEIGIGVVIALSSGIYLGYLSVVEFGLAGSLFAAHEGSDDEDTQPPPPDQPITASFG